MKSSLLLVCFQIILPYTWVKYARRCLMSVTLQFQHLQFAELYTGMDLQENSANMPLSGVNTKANLWQKFSCMYKQFLWIDESGCDKRDN